MYVVILAKVLGFGGAFVCALLLAFWSLFRFSLSVSVFLVAFPAAVVVLFCSLPLPPPSPAISLLFSVSLLLPLSHFTALVFAFLCYCFCFVHALILKRLGVRSIFCFLRRSLAWRKIFVSVASCSCSSFVFPLPPPPQTLISSLPRSLPVVSPWQWSQCHPISEFAPSWSRGGSVVFIIFLVPILVDSRLSDILFNFSGAGWLLWWRWVCELS